VRSTTNKILLQIKLYIPIPLPIDMEGEKEPMIKCCECDNEATEVPEWNLITGEDFSDVREPKFCYPCFARMQRFTSGMNGRGMFGRF